MTMKITAVEMKKEIRERSKNIRSLSRCGAVVSLIHAVKTPPGPTEIFRSLGIKILIVALLNLSLYRKQ
jgi:hypothetical protein